LHHTKPPLKSTVLLISSAIRQEPKLTSKNGF
jgi:hypothetical protein